MKLQASYNTEEEIPEGYADLYTERDGKWVFTAITGIKTQADVDRLTTTLSKVKAEVKEAKEKLAAFDGVNLEEIEAQKLALEEAQAQLQAINKNGNLDPEKLEPIIAARLKQAVAPLERDKSNLERALEAQKKAFADKEGEVFQLRTAMVTTTIERAIRDAAAEAKLIPTAILDATLQASRIFEMTEDGRIITADKFGATPGLSPKEWFADMQERSPHWWPQSVGGGSRGGNNGGGANSNPWSSANWNVTAQGQYLKTNGVEKAAQMAERAGVKLGATRPAAA